MSLFSSIQLGNNALRATQIGLQVAGNNIANANTPGYIREELVLSPAATQRSGDLVIGLGVKATGIIQKVDRFLRERLRAASSDLNGSEAQDNVYRELESILGELNDSDLSSSLTNFFGSIHDVLNQPESVPVRNLAVQRGLTLASDLQRLDSRVARLRDEVNGQLASHAEIINSLTTEIGELNARIVETEGGATSRSDAGGLRDQRQLALDNLAAIIDIRAVEQTSGSVTVFAGSDFLVFDRIVRQVETTERSDRGQAITDIQLVGTQSKLQSSAGKLNGLEVARDEILGGFQDELDDFARSLVFEFNKVHSGGQGLTGFDQVTGEYQVADVNTALDQAGLAYSPVTGSFKVLVRNTQTGLTETTDVFVDLNGLDDDTTLADLAGSIDAIDGISATITATRELQVTSDSPNIDFSFASDTSGALAALGVNTFFRGDSAEGIGVSQALLDDAGKFAASRDGIGNGTHNAELLAEFNARPLDSQDGKSIVVTYERLVVETSQAAAVSKAVTDGFRVFENTLSAQDQAISGVSIDEEVVRLIQYQRAYQAAARFISVSSELLDVLVNL